ncbi:carbonic anhydrase [Ancylobacter terrae]|uniref:carbonic anhydrase n=1 Tax=Ancylobacter sp. sgz301288 TaxID=3342077 RepID=UPI00385CB55D
MNPAAALSRRSLFGALACGCAAAGLGTHVPRAMAASDKPKTTLSADQALAKLKEGNAAFVKGGACVPAGGPTQIGQLAGGQAPFAVIVGCSDSRTPPEHIFGQGLGDLFIVRVAGNTVDQSGLGSIEYGVAVLGAPLVLVLGHSNCGAVEAAISMVQNQTVYPGAIEGMVLPIVPAVLRAQRSGGDIVAASVKANVEDVLTGMIGTSAILAKAHDAGTLRLAGGVYDLATGEVAFLS